MPNSLPLLILLLQSLPFFSSESEEKIWQADGYCSVRPVEQCCPGRNDNCTMPYHDTICYCDNFCNRTLADCCPDFLSQCFGIDPLPLRTNQPPATFKNNCEDEGHLYNVDSQITVNCYNCTCVKEAIKEEWNWKCTQRTCLIQPKLLKYVNDATKVGWTASNYSDFWGLTLDEGIRRRLGTRIPSDHITKLSFLKISLGHKPPTEFDARKEWPGLISPVLDQKDCASSWAFSTAGVASDRLRIHSIGLYNQTLSPQHLVSCNIDYGQKGCESGHIDRAWWFMRKIGIVTNDCFPYTSGETRKAGSCSIPNSYTFLKKSSCPKKKKVPTATLR